MKEVFSKGEDCAWLAQQIKNQMGRYVSFNQFGIYNQILTGVYSKRGTSGPCYRTEDVRFYIKFCKNEFLRIQIEIDCNNNENVASAMNELIKTLASIKQEDTLIGFPLAIYETSDCLTSEYAFKNQDTIIESLKNNTMFDDDSIENLRLLRTCDNYIYGSDQFEAESEKETLYCKDGEKQNIKTLCKSICDNKQKNTLFRHEFKITSW